MIDISYKMTRLRTNPTHACTPYTEYTSSVETYETTKLDIRRRTSTYRCCTTVPVQGGHEDAYVRVYHVSSSACGAYLKLSMYIGIASAKSPRAPLPPAARPPAPRCAASNGTTANTVRWAQRNAVMPGSCPRPCCLFLFEGFCCAQWLPGLGPDQKGPAVPLHCLGRAQSLHRRILIRRPATRVSEAAPASGRQPPATRSIRGRSFAHRKRRRGDGGRSHDCGI